MAKNLIIASANLEHWVQAGGTMIDGRVRQPRDFQSKLAWAKHLFGSIKPDVVAMQEIYDRSIEEVFTGLGNYQFRYSGGAPQQVAIATTLDFVDDPLMVQNLRNPVEIDRDGLKLKVDKLSRPILRARLNHEGQTLTVFVAHLKSKIPSYGDDPKKTYPEEDLATADFTRRPIGHLVSLVRRAAEAVALRAEIVREATEFPDRPIVVCGDLNDNTGAVTTDMVIGDSMRTFIENKPQPGPALANIFARLHQYLFTSTQEAHLRASTQSEFPTAVHEGRFSTLDHVFLSRHFFSKPRAVEGQFTQAYFFNYYEVANDHLVDDGSPFAPRKPETSDHGVVFAYCRKNDAPSPAALCQPSDLSLA
ncbi:MAG: endonuclease/exonuclease/phosphatase family protein [Myxococcota bacterium]